MARAGMRAPPSKMRAGASLRSSAASGLASLPDGDGGVLLALANYYGDSSLFAFDPGHLPRRAGKKPTAREVQRVSTSAAHDWEALRLPDGTEQLVVATVGKVDAKKRIEDSVMQLMSTNIVQLLGTMLDTVVF